MAKARRLSEAVFLSASLCAGCGPSLKSIRRYVETSPHQRMAVLPFTPAPGQPNSGQAAADILSEHLEDMGFVLVNRADLEKVMVEQKFSLSGAVRREDAAKLGQLLGVKAILTGTVADASQEIVRHPAIYEDRYKTVRGPDGNPRQVADKVLVMREELVHVPVFSVTARLTDVESGDLLWVGSGSDHIEGYTMHELMEKVIDRMARHLGERFLERRL